MEEADRVAAAPVVAAVAAAFEAEPVAVAAGATAAAVRKRHGQIPTSKQLMRPGGHAMRALTKTQDTQRNAICAIHPTPERHRGDVKREAAGALVMQAEWQHGVQQERQQERQ